MFGKIIKISLQLILAGAIGAGVAGGAYYVREAFRANGGFSEDRPSPTPQPSPSIYAEPIPYPTPEMTPMPTPTSPTPAETSDVIQYDANKKQKQEMLDRAMVEASICAHDMVKSRLTVGIRSKQKIMDEGIDICTRGLTVKTQVFGLPLTAEQIILIVKTDINREIEEAENN